MPYKREPRHTLCINCLMMQRKARRLSSNGNQWACSTIGGCSSVFTDSYLDHCYDTVKLLAESLGIDFDPLGKKHTSLVSIGKISQSQKGTIEPGSALERSEEAIATGQRTVILPDEDGS